MSSLTLSKEEEKRLKGLGFLNNKGTDNFSARILTVNGKVTAAQHRAMADAAETFGNGILTFTTRQTVEVQGIPYEKLEEFQEFVENAGMAIGGTGAKVRPVVSCKAEPPVSMDFWIRLRFQRRFINVFMRGIMM